MVAGERGFRGARLGEPYVYSWVDQKPTAQTWKEYAERQGCWLALVSLAACTLIGAAGGGGFGAALGFYFGLCTSAIFTSIGAGLVPNQSDDPVPKPTRREVYIEYAEGDFYLVMEVDGEVDLSQPWSAVRRFERADFWSMFGDGGVSPIKAKWHAIAMTPEAGPTWIIASTVAGESDVRQHFIEISRRFGEDARETFMSAYELNQKRAVANEAKSTREQTGYVPPRRDGVPKTL